MRTLCFILFLSCSKMGLAHSPDLSSLMIYEQNGTYFLIIKSSLTAFEGEIEYVFGKNSYETAEDFEKSVIKHFQQQCLIIMNDDTLMFDHPYVKLGHETTLFAVLPKVPKKLHSIDLKNTMFKDMPMNMSEVILMFKNLPQKQVILNNDNQHEIKLIIEKDQWIVKNHTNWLYNNQILLYSFLLFISFSIITIIAIRTYKAARRIKIENKLTNRKKDIQ